MRKWWPCPYSLCKSFHFLLTRIYISTFFLGWLSPFPKLDMLLKICESISDMIMCIHARILYISTRKQEVINAWNIVGNSRVFTKHFHVLCHELPHDATLRPLGRYVTHGVTHLMTLHISWRYAHITLVMPWRTWYHRDRQLLQSHRRPWWSILQLWAR